MDKFFIKCRQNAKEYENEGEIVEAVGEYHKMLSTLSSESIKNFQPAPQNEPLQLQFLNKLDQLSQQIPLDESIFKFAGVQQFQFSIPGVNIKNDSSIQSSIRSHFQQLNYNQPVSFQDAPKVFINY